MVKLFWQRKDRIDMGLIYSNINSVTQSDLIIEATRLKVDDNIFLMSDGTMITTGLVHGDTI